jgi:hypothetical protein
MGGAGVRYMYPVSCRLLRMFYCGKPAGDLAAELHCRRREVAVTNDSGALRPEERAAKALSPEAWPVVSHGVVHRRVRGFWISIIDLGTQTCVHVVLWSCKMPGLRASHTDTLESAEGLDLAQIS